MGPSSSTVAAIGSARELVGLPLAGVRAFPVEDDAQARAAWSTLGPDVAVVLLGERAAAALADERRSRGAPLSTELPR